LFLTRVVSAFRVASALRAWRSSFQSVVIGPEGPTVWKRTVAYFLHYLGAGSQAAVERLKVRSRNQHSCGLAPKLTPWPYYTYRIDAPCKSASGGGFLSASIKGHPESSISSQNQLLELPQFVAQAWTPIHRSALPRTNTPRQRQSGLHRSQVTPQPTDKSGKGRFLSRNNPVIQSFLLRLADHRAERFCCKVCCGHNRYQIIAVHDLEMDPGSETGGYARVLLL
jgi:hypothetical protein